MSTHPCAILGVFLMALFVQSSDSGRYQPKFENDVVAVYELELPARASAPILQSAHDTFWLSLTEAIVNFSGTRGKTDVALQAGDIRFFPSFETRLLTNKGASEFRGVMIALKPHGLFSNGCDCSGNTGRSICGCKGGGHLESLWALSLGDVTLAGTSLGAAESFRAASVRDDMLLVAITDLKLTDIVGADEDLDSSQLPILNLKPGDAVWIRGGRHQFKNVGADPARFITIEF